MPPRPAPRCAPHPRPAEAEALLAEWGRNELEEKSTPKWLIFLKMVRTHALRWCLPLQSDAHGAACLPAPERDHLACRLCAIHTPIPPLPGRCAQRRAPAA